VSLAVVLIGCSQCQKFYRRICTSLISGRSGLDRRFKSQAFLGSVSAFAVRFDGVKKSANDKICAALYAYLLNEYHMTVIRRLWCYIVYCIRLVCTLLYSSLQSIVRLEIDSQLYNILTIADANVFSSLCRPNCVYTPTDNSTCSPFCFLST
jgi:hypothetical protein